MAQARIGFIGLGVMGEPICRNILTGSGLDFTVFDLAEAPLERMAERGARVAANLCEVVESSDIIFLSLPGGPEVEKIVLGEEGVLASGRAGQCVIDLSTTPVDLTRELAGRLAEKGLRFADAPVARTRQAAEDGTLSIMVGADAALFGDVRPLLAHAATEVTHCGDVGCGQVVKILNNMVLFETVVALAEALTIGEAAGVDRTTLFETLSKGSADSFALRNHGMKAMLPDNFPQGAFPTDYAIKDCSYALALAEHVNLKAPGANHALSMLKTARAAGFGKEYFPVLARVTGKD
ncbi:NAD(P)-dependent oxidoreductase [Fodinicurvata halophila]|uniref:NAD(P)-dependent oxidoreductase n=2 Tax=Fodinicurvata halophila TaxID=1419723 RepID=A0ABV8UHS7_9PROT